MAIREQLIIEYEQSFRALQSEIDSLQAQIQSGTAIDFELGDAENEIRDVKSSLEGLQDSAGEVNLEFNGDEVVTEIEAVVSSAAGLGDIDIPPIDVPTEEFAMGAEAAEELGDKFDELGLDAEELTAKFAQNLPAGAQVAVNALLSINPAVAATAAAFGALAVLGTQFESVANEIQIATGATGSSLDGLTESALNISEEVPASMAVTADSVGILNTFLGSTETELESLSIAVIDVSRLLGEDATSNAQNFAQTLNLFGVPAQEGVENLDLLFAATQKYGIGLGELLGSLESAGGIFQAVGLDLEQSTTLIGQFNLAGLGASESQAALTQVIARSEDTGRSFNEVLLDLQTSIQNAATEQDAFNIGIDAFGTRSGVAFSQAIRSGVIDLQALSGQLGDTNGLIAQTASDTETAGQSFRESLSTIVNALEPIATATIGVVNAVAGAIASLPDFAVQLGAIAVAAGAVAFAFNPLAGAVAAAVLAFSAFGEILETDLDRTLQSVAEGTDAYTSSLLAGLPANEETELAISGLIDKYNELALATGDAAVVADDLVGQSQLRVFYAELDDAAKEVVDDLIEASGGVSEFNEALVESAEDGIPRLGGAMGVLIDRYGQGSERAQILTDSLNGLIGAQQEQLASSEEEARVRFTINDGLTAYEERVRVVAFALRDAGTSVTPFIDAQNVVNQQIIDFQLVAGDSVVAVEEYAGAIGAIGDGLGDVLSIDFDINEFLGQQVAEARAQVEGIFGDPFTPRIKDEDFEAYLDRVAELQASIASEQLNLLKLEAELDEDEFANFLDIIEELGPEAARAFTEDFADAIGSEDFNELRDKLFEAVANEELATKLAATIAAAKVSPIPVDIDLSAEELTTLANQALELDANINYSTEELEQLLEETYNINAIVNLDDSEADAFENRTLQVAGVLSLNSDIDAFLDNLQAAFDANPINITPAGVGAEDGAYFGTDGVRYFDRGGFMAWNPGPGVPFAIPGGGMGIMGESHRGPEVAEYGPNGLAIVGPYHDDNLTMRRLEGAGINLGPAYVDRFLSSLPRIEPIVSQQFQMPHMNTAPIVSELAAMRSEHGAQLAVISNELRDIKQNSRQLPAIAGNTDDTANATRTLADRRPARTGSTLSKVRA